MKHCSTLLLNAVVIIIGIVVLTLCILVLPMGIRNEEAGGYLPIFIGMYIPAIPFFIALFHILRLINFIDKNQAFSKQSVKSLKIIKYCTIVISILYGAGLPYIYLMAERDDAPGVLLIGLIFTFAPMIVAVFAANLQKLLQNALTLKKENELTV